MINRNSAHILFRTSNKAIKDESRRSLHSYPENRLSLNAKLYRACILFSRMLILLNRVWILSYHFCLKKNNVAGIVHSHNPLHKYSSVLMWRWNYVKEHNLLNCHTVYIITIFNISRFTIWNKSYLTEVFLSWYHYNKKNWIFHLTEHFWKINNL